MVGRVRGEIMIFCLVNCLWTIINIWFWFWLISGIEGFYWWSVPYLISTIIVYLFGLYVIAEREWEK